MVAHGSLGILALLLDILGQLLAALLGGAGNTRRMTWPSSMGLMPMSLVWMALEMGLSIERSHGEMVRMRASATATAAIC